MTKKKKIKKPYYQETIKSVVAEIAEKQLRPSDINRELRGQFSSEVGRIVRFALDLGPKDFFDYAEALLEDGAPQESVDFLSDLVSRHGTFFEGFREYIDFPKAVEHIRGESYYHPTKGLLINAYLERRGMEAFNIEGPPTGFVSMAQGFLTAVISSYELNKKNVPSLDLEIRERDLKNLKDLLQKLESLIKK